MKGLIPFTREDIKIGDKIVKCYGEEILGVFYARSSFKYTVDQISIGEEKVRCGNEVLCMRKSDYIRHYIDRRPRYQRLLYRLLG